MPRIAKVVVEISLGREFDYLIPPRLQQALQLGSRVQVPFRHATTRGYVVGFADRSAHAQLKEIGDIIGARPLLSPTMLKLARWMSEYYCSTVEQAIRTVLPCAIRRSGARHRELLFVAAGKAAEDKTQLAALAGQQPRHAELLELLRAVPPQPMAEFMRRNHVSAGLLRGLEKRQLVIIRRQAADRNPMEHLHILPTSPLQLFPEQAQSLALVRQAINQSKPTVVLLHGVTGSGKTEVYLQAIQDVLNQGRGAVMLVPEISLTPQTVERFHSRFGDAIAVLHSHLSDGERHDEWHRIHDGRARIAIGARSALFAPVADLGLIIVDEEHEPSYKQSEAPRYNARDVAVMRGHMEGCAVVLGSATPALESIHNVQRGKYTLSPLTHRVDHQSMPRMQIVDMRAEMEKEGRLNVFSRVLLDAMRQRLNQSEQVILFLNRRGFATTVMCPTCGYTAKCPHCSVSLTYHRAYQEVCCHICGNTARAPERCPECSAPTLKFNGIGTQRIESAVRKLFPHARIQRMDADTASTKQAYATILGDFKAARTDILIGTQMIAKGLHFPGVTLVGIICADSSLHLPDFRAAERTFQLLLQVAGRAGRGEIPGEVFVQTFSPAHPAIQCARQHDCAAFFEQELKARRELMYPPYAHLICVTLACTDENRLTAYAEKLEHRLRRSLPGNTILSGPMPAPLSKIKERYRQQIMMRATSVSAMTRPLQATLKELPAGREIQVAVDVDALSLM
ncbi:MAG: primosomal protein N' [Kiritimatiellia bacterium]|nr:primosomal protein N' [Lentisphaerota bacterium]